MGLYWKFDPLGTAGGTLTPIAGSRGVFLSSGTTLVSSAMKISGGTVGTGYPGDNMYIYSGGVATDTTVLNGGNMYIFSGGVASGITRDKVASGDIYVSAHGRANDIVQSARYLYCFGGTVSHVNMLGGALVVRRRAGEPSGQAEDVVMAPWTTLAVYDSATVVSCVLSGTSAKANVSSGGLISSAVVSTGLLTVYNGGTAHTATISSGGSLTVSSGGVATDVTSMTGAVVTDARPLLTMSPATGDINVMIVVAVILIALFLLFVLWKGRRRRGG